MTSKFINSYLENEDLNQEFKSGEPFEHISIENLFNSEKLEELTKELSKIDYYLEDHDLYQFLRTVDFKHIQNQVIKDFREFIFSDEFINFIEKIIGFKLLRNKGDLHSLKLLDTHYLLCHDDQVQDRSIAFILNLSKNWSEDKGGSLDLYTTNSTGEPTKIVERIIPNFNQFNMFKVSEKSFHQISEVEGEKSERLSISGWFYKAEYERGE